MEDDKLAEYYDDLTRRGGGAARFKQGLGFSADAASAKDDVPPRGSALPSISTSSCLNSFVRASSPAKASEFEKRAKLQSIQNKLSKKPKEKSLSRRSRSRNRSRDRDTDKHGKRRSRSRERNSRRRRRSVGRRSRRSRSREVEPRGRYRSRSRSRDKNRESRRHRSPEERRSQTAKKLGVTSGGGGIDFAKSIEGYDSMTPAERVKAKMKLQLSKTAENDEMIGKGSRWERFDFDKDAPLDDDEEIEAAEDDAMVVKHMGQSFRFSALEAKREEQIKSAHDEAIFGGPSFPRPAETEDESGNDTNRDETAEEAPVSSLLSDQILTMQGGSWRDRARKT